MGDRANICIKEDEHKLYIYAHNDGQDLYVKAQEGLRAAIDYHREEDYSYFARIMIDTVLKKAYRPDIGYGISPFLTDNERPILTFNLNTKMVSLEGKFNVSYPVFLEMKNLNHICDSNE